MLFYFILFFVGNIFSEIIFMINDFFFENIFCHLARTI